MALPIFSTATVLTLSGLNFNLSDLIPTYFGSKFSTAPYTRVKVDYPASTAANSIPDGVVSLDTAVRAVAGPKIVLAMSQGCQVVARWLRAHKDDGTAPPASELQFILVGNPLRAIGGYIIGRTEIGGAIGLPTPIDTQWKIFDIARRYEGWPDWPTDETNKLAVQNATSGKTAFHGTYPSVTWDDPTWTVWTPATGTANTTYVLTKEDILPIYRKRTYPLPASVISSNRRKIEQGYNNRPVVDPPPAVVPTTSFFWKILLQLQGLETE